MAISKHAMVVYIQQRHVINMSFVNSVGTKALRKIYNKLVLAEHREKQHKTKVKPQINNENKKNT